MDTDHRKSKEASEKNGDGGLAIAIFVGVMVGERLALYDMPLPRTLRRAAAV